jgi:hypothetical protein
MRLWAVRYRIEIASRRERHRLMVTVAEYVNIVSTVDLLDLQPLLWRSSAKGWPVGDASIDEQCHRSLT